MNEICCTQMPVSHKSLMKKPLCSIVAYAGSNYAKIDTYINFLHSSRISENYEVFIVTDNDFGIGTNPYFKEAGINLVVGDGLKSQEQLYSIAAQSAKGRYLLFVKGLLEFDGATLEESIKELEASGQRMSVSAHKNFVLTKSAPCSSQTNLEGDGERVDIFFKNDIKFCELGNTQKSHYKRYQFAKSFISPGKVVGDFACGTGYGSVMLSEKAGYVIGADINGEVVSQIQARYKDTMNVEFVHSDLLDLNYESLFDYIISFETIEHLKENDIPKLFGIYSRALKAGGAIIFSTPYIQERSEAAIKMGFHQTFYIDEAKINQWLATSNLKPECFKYQNYQTHSIVDSLGKKDFIICVARSCKQELPKMHPPKVSIIIPTYNRSNYLREAIDSAISQTYPNVEIMVLDDCSNDDTSNVLESYSSRENITCIRNGQNIGFIKNWNKAVLLSSGEYIKIMGDDDILESNCIAEQVKILNEHHDVGVVCCDYHVVDENGNIKDNNDSYRLFDRDTKEAGEEFTRNYLSGKRRVGWPASILFRKEDFGRAGVFDVSAGTAADIDMWCRILRDKNFCYLDQKLARNRQFSDNLSKSLSRDGVDYFTVKTHQYLKEKEEEKTARKVIDEFHKLYYEPTPLKMMQPFQNTYWLGAPILQYPVDMFTIAEILWDTQPDYIIECGTNRGGASFFFASMFELIGKGKVITIDNTKKETPGHRIFKERVACITGSSTDPRVVEAVKTAVGNSSVMVFLDSDHSKAHVLKEMQLYSDLVTIGNYMIVEDGTVNGHPLLPDYGPGPYEAIQEFLTTRDDFQLDEEKEKKHLITSCPSGFLRKVKKR